MRWHRNMPGMMAVLPYYQDAVWHLCPAPADMVMNKINKRDRKPTQGPEGNDTSDAAASYSSAADPPPPPPPYFIYR